jgi:hypothetical protein
MSLPSAAEQPTPDRAANCPPPLCQQVPAGAAGA